jgi:hypothetical protein
MSCDNRHGLFGGYMATLDCTDHPTCRVTVDEEEVHLKPMLVCDSCLVYIEETMYAREMLYGRPTKVTIERIE